jgi:hypothetical protein
MKRTLLISALAILCAHGTTLASFAALIPAPEEGSKVKSIHVTAKSIEQLPEGRKYVIDLTRGDEMYDLDAAERPIDFSRIILRTSEGESAISFWLGNIFSAKAGAGLHPQRIAIGTTKAFRSVGLPRGPRSSSAGLGFSCGAIGCICHGDFDCNDMFSTNSCGAWATCYIWGTDVICICGR